MSFLGEFPLLRLHTVAAKNMVNLTEYAMPEERKPRKTNMREMNMYIMYQGTIGCIPSGAPMVFIVFSRDSLGL